MTRIPSLALCKRPKICVSLAAVPKYLKLLKTFEVMQVEVNLCKHDRDRRSTLVAYKQRQLLLYDKLGVEECWTEQKKAEVAFSLCRLNLVFPTFADDNCRIHPKTVVEPFRRAKEFQQLFYECFCQCLILVRV